MALTEGDIVGWASDRDPRLAEVLCVRCWDAEVPHERVHFWCPVRRDEAHLTVCAECGDEPGEYDDPADRPACAQHGNRGRP